MLTDNKFYGFKAKDVYNRCCNEYGFDPNLAKRFSYRQRLYAGNATPEGFGVWFIANNNWNKSKGGSWQNTIAGNFSWITEKWDKNPNQVIDCFDSEKRVVFAKDPRHSDGYIFLGVYKPVLFDERTKTRRFERVASQYDAA